MKILINCYNIGLYNAFDLVIFEYHALHIAAVIFLSCKDSDSESKSIQAYMKSNKTSGSKK